MAAAQPTTVKINDLADIAGAVPVLLGFSPQESLVAIALCGPRQRIEFTMRLDLGDPLDDELVAAETARRMVRAGAESVLLFVHTDEPIADGLPRRELVEEIEQALPVPLLDAALVADGRVRSYLCADPRCCPPEGRKLRADSQGALALAAAHVLAGEAVLPNRDAVVASTRAVGGITAKSMRQALARAWIARRGDGDEQHALDLVDRLCVEQSDGASSIDHDQVARVVVQLHDVHFRDVLIQRLARDDEALHQLVGSLARLAQPPHDAPAAALLAVAGYLRGRGVVASAAAERALESDPGYSLAHLVLDALDAQVEPSELRALWRAPMG